MISHRRHGYRGYADSYWKAFAMAIAGVAFYAAIGWLAMCCLLPAPVLAPDASDGGWILAHTSPTFDAGNGSLR